MRKRKKVLIIGAGAAGLACASALKTETVILEAAASPGRKLAISGGGRANFTNLRLNPESYSLWPESATYPDALRGFSPKDALVFVSPLPWEEREQGKIFLKVPAAKLVELLLKKAKNAKILYNHQALRVERGDGFLVRGKNWQERGDFLILANGSPARPGLGGNASGWRLAKSLGLNATPPKPALTPFSFSPNPYASLAGVSVRAEIALKTASEIYIFRDDLLFTHQGLSGPAILRASLRWRPDAETRINFYPARNFEKELDENPVKTPLNILKRGLPERLAEFLLPNDLARVKCAEISRKNRRELSARVNSHAPPPFTPEGFDKAEVATGGVACDELNPRDQEALRAPGLYVIGELAAVTGDLGGYNLHWAFASGLAAARAINAKLDE